MGFAAELNFDPESDAAVRELWRRLADAGISSFMLDVDAEPHISLTVFDETCGDFSLTIARQVVNDFASTCPPFEFKLSAVGCFPTNEGVVYLAPIVTPELLNAHAGFHRRLAEAGLRSHAYYRPGNWIPHCSVAAQLAAHSVGDAVELCRSMDLFNPGRFESVALVEYRPVVYHARSVLTG